jgi:glyoxylase-like metal-dependent hydrolase (beta-lactamase superfamily II)
MPDPRVHHLNCGTMCPRGQRFLSGHGSLLGPAKLVCHVLLVEGPDGLTLIDTGFGTNDVAKAAEMDRGFKLLTRPTLDNTETALEQIKARGLDPADVKHIVMTHLDIDHGGGLPDFPAAQVHLWSKELEAMQNPPRKERRRYVIAKSQWAHGPNWVPHDTEGDEWMGFESVRALPNSEAEILLIPLPGHSLGHTAVAVRHNGGWLLHCGDGYFFHGEVETPPHCPGGLKVFESLVQADGKLRHQNQDRLRDLASRHSSEVTLICSHDPEELERAQAEAQPQAA